MPGRTNDDCRERNPKFFKDYIDDNNFCAGNLNSNSICRGDSGGGLVMHLKDGWYIRGIASLTPSMRSGPLDVCDLTQFAIFTDVVQFADWINENMDESILYTLTINQTVIIPTTTKPLRSDGTCESEPSENILAVRSYPWHAGIYRLEGIGIRNC